MLHQSDWFRDNFDFTDNNKEFLTAEQILEYVRESFPETNGRVNDVGRVVKFVFGEKVCNDRRIDGKICYRIKSRKEQLYGFFGLHAHIQVVSSKLCK